MEIENCSFEGCSETSGFSTEPDLNPKLCWAHMQELNKSGKTSQQNIKALNHFYRPLFRKQGYQIPRSKLVNAFGTNCICWSFAEDSSLTGEITTAFNRILDLFLHKFFKIEAGGESKLEKLCQALTLSLNQIIYNLLIDSTTVFQQIIQIFTDYISHRQELIVRLFTAELSDLTARLNMPKTATKNLINTVNLDAFINDFIKDLLKIGILEFDKVFEKFLNHFSPFLKNKPTSNVFDSLEKTFQYELDKIQHKFKNELKPLIISVWEKNRYVNYSVFLREIKDEALEWGHGVVVLTSLLLVNGNIELKSVTQLSVYDLLLVLEINNDSYVIHYHDKSAYLLDVFRYTQVICADGSNENIMVLYIKSDKRCILYQLHDFRMYPTSEFNLKLQEDEYLFDLIYIEGSRHKIVYSTNNFILSSIHEKGPRCYINIDHDDESNFKLKYFKQKELILLKTQSKLRVFSEKLEKIGEYSISLDNYTYYLTNSRVLRILDLKYNYIEEFWLDVKLDYAERFYKSLPLPRNAIQFVTRSYEGVNIDELNKEFLQYFNRPFLIS